MHLAVILVSWIEAQTYKIRKQFPKFLSLFYHRHRIYICVCVQHIEISSSHYLNAQNVEYSSIMLSNWLKKIPEREERLKETPPPCRGSPFDSISTKVPTIFPFSAKLPFLVHLWGWKGRENAFEEYKIISGIEGPWIINLRRKKKKKRKPVSKMDSHPYRSDTVYFVNVYTRVTSKWIIESEGCTLEPNSDTYDVNVKQLFVAIERIYEIIPRIWYAPVVASSAMI